MVQGRKSPDPGTPKRVSHTLHWCMPAPSALSLACAFSICALLPISFEPFSPILDTSHGLIQNELYPDALVESYGTSAAELYRLNGVYEMASSVPSPPGGLPLGELRKDVPPGWAPGDPSYPLKLFMERLRMWYRTFEGADETVGPLLAGRLQGRAQAIAHSLRLPDPTGNIDVGDAALVRLAVDEVRDPANPNNILQHHIPSGVQALCNALKEAFGDADQVQATRALEQFFDMRKGRLSLQEFAVEWNLKLEDAITHSGLNINSVAKTFLFFRASQLPQKHVDDILLQLHGDMSRFEDARNLALRLAHRQQEQGHFYEEEGLRQHGIEEEYAQDWHETDNYYQEPWYDEQHWQDQWSWQHEWPEEAYYDQDEAYYENHDPNQDDWYEDDQWVEEEPAHQQPVAAVDDYYKGKGKDP